MKISVEKRERPLYEIKEDGGDEGGNKQTVQPEVFAAVQAEIKQMGSNTKALSESLQKSVKELRDVITATGAKLDALDREKVSKLSEDITSRQEKMDETLTARMDDIEVAVKRVMASGGQRLSDHESKEFDLARTYKVHQLVAHKSLPKTGLPNDQVSVEDYRNYLRAMQVYLRVDEKNIGISHPEEFKYLTTGSDPDGGILVTPVMSARVVERIWEMDPIRQLASVEAIGTDALEMLEDLGQFGVDWEGETVSTTIAGTSQFNKKRIPVHIQSARPYATQAMIDDASINLEEWIAKKVSDKFGRAEAAAFVAGNGINKPRGFLTYADYAGNKGDGGVTLGQIEQRGSGAAASITTDGLITLKYSLVEDLLTRGTWLFNRLTIATLMQLKDGDGQYIWRPGITEGQPSTLLGLPLRMSTSMPTVAANALAGALGDWREAYQIVDRQGITVQRDPYTKKPFVEFYTRRRVGGDVVNFQAVKLLFIGTPANGNA
jgi:HK97 family phage major capsid protein